MAQRSQSDEDILRRVAAGESSAYALLVDRYKDRGFALAVRMLRRREDAEEALQDAFVRAYTALAAFQGRSSFGTWFYRILYNVCSTRLRLRTGTDVGQDDNDLISIPMNEPLPNALVEAAELRAIVEKEIDLLSPNEAAVLTFFYLHDMSYDEIVAVTGMPLGTVKTRLSRARLKLREAVLRSYRIPGKHSIADEPFTSEARNEH